MQLHPRVTRPAVELVKRFEGLRRRAARLPDGGWTVGYGHTRSAREGAVVTPEDADALLYYDLSEVAQKVEAWTFTPLNQNQFEALTAFTFNIGVENFRRSSVLKRVNEGQHLMAAAALELWRKADFGGEDLVVDALVRRRAAEKAHYLTPPEGFKPSPTPVLRPTFDHSVIEIAANCRAGRNAAVVDAPLDGEDATVTVERRAEPDSSSEAAGPSAATLAGAGAATADLHKLFPEKTPQPDQAAEPDGRPFSLQPEIAPFALKAVNDQPFGQTADAGPAAEPSPPLGLPPAPARVAATSEAFGGFASPPVRQFEVTPAPEVMETAPHPAFSPAVKPTPLLDRPSMISAPERDVTAQHGEPYEARSADRIHDATGMGEIDDALAPRLTLNRTWLYTGIGLLGVFLFAAALFSMFSGKATPVNLVIGLIGILLMTPAGGYFLLQFLNKGEDLPAAT